MIDLHEGKNPESREGKTRSRRPTACMASHIARLRPPTRQAALLERAGIASGATEVILEGSDQATIDDEPKSPGAISFARSLPLAKVRADEVTLVWKKNGAELTPEQGFPVRAIPSCTAARPTWSERVTPGSTYRVAGAACTGESERAKSAATRAGRGRGAKLLGASIPFAWRLSEFSWDEPAATGGKSRMVRATDRSGCVQPDHHDKDKRSYLINHVVPIEVIVG